SARSIQPYDLHAGLASASAHLARFGGHRMAAGLELEEGNLQPFRAALLEHARTALRPEDLVPIEKVDAIVPGDAVCLELAEELEALRPFGMGNPPVRLLLPGARLAELRPMGEGRHARFTIASAGVPARASAARSERSIEANRSRSSRPGRAGHAFGAAQRRRVGPGCLR